MKRHLIGLGIGVGMSLAAAGMLMGQTTAPAVSTAVLLEKAIYQEETVGDLDAAAKLYRQIVEQEKAARPQAAQAMYRLGVLLIKQKHGEEGTALLAQLEKDYADQKELVAKAKSQVAAARGAMGAEEVTKIVDKAVNAISTMGETDPKLAGALASMKGLDGNAVAAALVKHLDDPLPEMRRSALYVLWMGPIDDVGAAEAFAAMRKLLEHSENTTRGMAALALGARKDGESYEAMKKMLAGDADGYARRCAAYALGLLGKGEAKEALTLATSDKDPMVAANARAALKMLAEGKAGGTGPGEKEKMAAADFAAAGWKRWFDRDFDQAETLFQQAVDKDATKPSYWNGLGWSQFNLGKRDHARVAFEKAVELDPKLGAAWNGLGWIAYGENQKEKAVGHWMKAYEATPSATAAISGLAQVALEMGEYEKAIDWCNKVLKYEPDNADVKALVEKAKMAQAAVKEAMPAAEEWLKHRDAGQDDVCYEMTSATCKKAVTLEGWKKSAAGLNALLGKAGARKLVRAVYMTELPGGPDGQYVVIEYQTEFENKKAAAETITPQKDTDGKWRVSGYFVK